MEDRIFSHSNNNTSRDLRSIFKIPASIHEIQYFKFFDRTFPTLLNMIIWWKPTNIWSTVEVETMTDPFFVHRAKWKLQRETREGKWKRITICPKLKTPWKWLKDRNLRPGEITLARRNEHDFKQSSNSLSLSFHRLATTVVSRYDKLFRCPSTFPRSIPSLINCKQHRLIGNTETALKNSSRVDWSTFCLLLR